MLFGMKVFCVFSLESPQRGDSNKYTQYTISHIKKENHPKLSQICSYGICSKGLKNEFETAWVNELSVFEPLKLYCTCIQYIYLTERERQRDRDRESVCARARVCVCVCV